MTKALHIFFKNMSSEKIQKSKVSGDVLNAISNRSYIVFVSLLRITCSNRQEMKAKKSTYKKYAYT
jgi:hypothetical protein